MSTIIKELYETVRRSDKSVADLADSIGMGESHLYKATTPGEAGCNFPLQKLIPLMKETRDYRVLQRIARLCDFILVKVPRSKKFDLRKIGDYQLLLTELIQYLYKLIEGKITKEECLKKINETLDETWQVRKAVEKWDQRSFEFNGEDKI